MDDRANIDGFCLTPDGRRARPPLPSGAHEATIFAPRSDGGAKLVACMASASAPVWQKAKPGDAPLHEHEVHLWAWELDDTSAHPHTLARLLAADERARMASFHFERDRLAYLLARGTLRRILGPYLSMSPQAIRFAYSGYGKPSLDPGHGSLDFNLSHTKRLAVVAVSSTLRVGIDIEDKHPIEPGVAQQSCSQEEQEALQSLAPGQRLDSFYRCWTRKEAIAKAEGLGLNLDMSAFSVSLRPDDPPRIDSSGDVLSRPWSLLDIPMGSNVAGALAVSERPSRVRLLRMDTH